MQFSLFGHFVLCYIVSTEIITTLTVAWVVTESLHFDVDEKICEMYVILECWNVLFPDLSTRKGNSNSTGGSVSVGEESTTCSIQCASPYSCWSQSHCTTIKQKSLSNAGGNIRQYVPVRMRILYLAVNL